MSWADCARRTRPTPPRRLSAIDGVELVHPDAPFFKEFAVSLPRDPAEVIEALVDRGILAGVPVPEGLLVAVTERRSKKEIDALATGLAEVLAS